MRLARTALLATLLVGAAAACSNPASPTPPPSPRALGWQSVDLPGGASPLLVRTGPDLVLVAARSGDRASLFRLPASHSAALLDAEPVALEPHGVYAPGARWVDLAVDGSRVLAIGRAAGGAHGIPRWTVWDGSPDRLVERPQPFETFGGPRSGGLAAVAPGPEEVVVGTWDDGGPGLDARLWSQTSPHAWQRNPVAPALASTATVLPQPVALARSATGLVLVGSVTDLGGGPAVVTRATAWTAPTATGPWTRLDLPATTTAARATGVACSGERCWVVGADGSRPAAWQVDPDGVTRAALPALPTSPEVAPVLALAGTVPWVAVGGADHVVLTRPEGAGWISFAGPPGRPLSLAASSGRLDLVAVRGTATELWTAPAG